MEDVLFISAFRVGVGFNAQEPLLKHRLTKFYSSGSKSTFSPQDGKHVMCQPEWPDNRVYLIMYLRVSFAVHVLSKLYAFSEILNMK